MARVVQARLPRFFRIARRIARAFSPRVADAFEQAIARLQRQIDPVALRSAVAGGSARVVEAAVATGGNLQLILEDQGLDKIFQGAAVETGAAGATVLEEATGLAVTFNRFSPRTVMFARRQTAELVVAISVEQAESIRIVTGLGAGMGLTVQEQARAVREVVGLPPNWANAPLALRENILAGDAAAATNRRLSATDKARIRSRIARGTVDEEFVAEMQARYARSLVNARALTIARTESLRAAHAGQREGWRQAMEQGAIPRTARRFWVVTPDERLSHEHALIPGLNEEGRGLDEMFDTPDGWYIEPPIRPNCRCGTGLMFPGLRGVL